MATDGIRVYKNGTVVKIIPGSELAKEICVEENDLIDIGDVKLMATPLDENKVETECRVKIVFKDFERWEDGVRFLVERFLTMLSNLKG